MFYNSFRVLNYTHIHEVIIKQGVKGKKKRKKVKIGLQTSLLILPQTPSFSFFPPTADNFVSFLFHNQEEKDREVSTNLSNFKILTRESTEREEWPQSQSPINPS